MTADPDGLPPPTYATTHPQILVAPLPDAASFFSGLAVRGEVFVKGLGESGASSVKSLNVELHLVNHLPEHPPLPLHEFAPLLLWPPHTAGSSSSATPFPSVHRFDFSLPSDLPGTLNLAPVQKGEIKWTIRVRLETVNENVTEDILVEGTPMDIGEPDQAEGEAEEIVDRSGVRSRLLVADPAPRLGSLLHLGVELRPLERKKTGVAGLSSQPDPTITLRALRRIRVELYRIVRLTSGDTHLSLLHASGKSLRFPGANQPPLRLLFTLPTAQLGSTADGTWGETSVQAPYHATSFFVRVTLGFGALGEAAPPDLQDWVLQRTIRIRPRLWVGPEEWTSEEMAEAYRRKGRDVVGSTGTWRGDAGPSADLPSFSESEAIAPPREQVVGREGLSGELASWVEYDGYETFSVAPPSVSASYGVSGPMDPPQPDDDPSAVGGMAAQLGMRGMELMERLGLGEGTRVVDLQDDLPPGIDEPSLPALPSFNSSQLAANRYPHPPAEQDSAPAHDMSPPSFAASEAAQAAGGVANSTVHRGSISAGSQPNSHGPHVSGSELGGGGVGGTVPSRHGSILVSPLPSHDGPPPPHPARVAGHGQAQGQGQGQGQDREDPPGYFGASAGPPAYS